MATSGISLTAGMRGSVISLQGIAKSIDRTQERLSTGRKVNSALDNPTNFFTSQAHLNRASDLRGTLDGVMEAVQNVRAAFNGISALSALLESMKGIVEAASGTYDPAAKSRYAEMFDKTYEQLNSIVSDSSYRGTNLIGDTDISPLIWKADDLKVNFNSSGYSELTIAGNFLGTGYALYENGDPDTGWVGSANGTNLIATKYEPPPVTKLDFVFVIDTTGSMGGYLDQVKANVSTFIDNLQAQGVDGRYAFSTYGDINDGEDPVRTAPTFFTDAASFTSALSAIGVSAGGDYPESGLEGILTTVADLTFRADATKRMLLITDAIVHTTADGLSANTIADTAATVAAAGIQLDVAAPVGGDQQPQLTPLATATGGSFYDISDPTFFNTGFGYTAPLPSYSTSSLTIQSADYDNGVFSIHFNDALPASVKTMTAEKSGLGLYHSWLYDGFSSAEGAKAAANDLENAVGIIREQSVSFGSTLTILTTRETFTTEISNLLLEGSDKLTLADMNEEGANMLMLQTRQSLGTTALSMSAQNSQSIMRLF